MNRNKIALPAPRRGIVPTIDVHRRLKIARDIFDSSISQDDFGALIGVSGNTISNYENGHTTRLKDLYIRNWADVTGVDYWWIKTGKGPASEEAEPLTEMCTPRDLNPEPTGYRTTPATGLHPRKRRARDRPTPRPGNTHPRGRA